MTALYTTFILKTATGHFCQWRDTFGHTNFYYIATSQKRCLSRTPKVLILRRRAWDESSFFTYRYFVFYLVKITPRILLWRAWYVLFFDFLPVFCFFPVFCFVFVFVPVKRTPRIQTKGLESFTRFLSLLVFVFELCRRIPRIHHCSIHQWSIDPIIWVFFHFSIHHFSIQDAWRR